MKYAPQKVFILENGKYTEISYQEFCNRKERNTCYKDKLFLPMHGMLMEVTKDRYMEHYREKRRQKYIDECSKANGEILYDSLSTDDFNGEDILVAPDADVCTQVTDKLMKEKLCATCSLLPDDEKELIHRHYHEEIPETELAKIYGVSQQAISKRIKKIREKLKNLWFLFNRAGFIIKRFSLRLELV